MQQTKPLADKNGIVCYELLPYPIVHYPGFYGIFLGFRKNKKSSLALCSCSRAAIVNYLSIILMNIEDGYIDEGIRTDGFNTFQKGKLTLDKRFPDSLIKKFSKKGCKPEEILGRLDFQLKLCHECNGATPAYLYCPNAYGSSFKQNYGWYMNKISLDYGVLDGNVYFPELCPPEVLDLVEIPIVKDGMINRNYRHWKNTDKTRKQRDRIERALENIIRQRFGHKQIGDAWTNETILYRIVLSLFPSFTVIRHYRPYFLRGLELDIYIPEIKLGVEYQGIQHYQSIEHWGGIESLEHLQERDARKKRLCSSNKVKLVYFEYTEGLSNKFVAEKLKGYLQQLFII